jgi:hypothetical protein
MASNNELPTHRMVNGEQVPLTQEEINEIALQWEQAANNPPFDAALDEAKRELNIKAMKKYMKEQVSVQHYDMFLNDVSSHQQAYKDAGTRLETWIETTSRNGYSAILSGFKTKPYGNNERSEHILSILSDL